MSIRIERSEVVATIVMDRPEARNAVDGPAAQALVEAFDEFERDDALRVAVLWGAGGTFCAGADLKARGSGRGLRLSPDGHGPMGPTRMAFTSSFACARSVVMLLALSCICSCSRCHSPQSAHSGAENSQDHDPSEAARQTNPTRAARDGL